MEKMKEFDRAAQRRAQEKWDRVAKPLNSLGKLEKMIAKIAGIQGTDDIALSPRCALVFCADHGVVEEGVTQSPASVTAQVARSIAEGGANINLMAAGTDVFAVDMGMEKRIVCPGLIDRRVMDGTDNMAKGPAMTRAQALQALRAGEELIGEMKARGYRMAATGEMGIGNTTAASAVACVLLDLPAEKMTGRGAGLSDEGLKRKISAIERAIALNRPDKNDALDVLAKVGGLEIAAMAGAFIGGRKWGVPVVIDGVISAVAALCAERICPGTADFMLASHVSREPAGRLLLDELGLEGVLHADMALGEGTGAVLLFPILEAAARVYMGEHTFESIGVAQYTPQEDKK